MKKLLTILFILIAFKSNSQTVQKIAPGEYCTLNIAADGKLYSSGSNFTLLGTGNTGRIGLPNLVKQQSGAAMPLFKSAWAGLDDAAAIDVSGNVWKIGGATLAAAGNGSTEPDYNNPDTALKYYHAIKILTDSSGNSFTGITMCAQFWESYQTKGWFAVKGTDSTLWIWGGDELGNFRGTGVAQQYMSRPRKVTIPGNRKVLQVVAGTFVVVRCSDGTVWTWGGGAGCNDYHAALGNGCTGTSYKYPTQVPGIRNAKWIDGGRSRAFVICQNDTVWAWGNKAYLGIGTTDGNPQTTPLYVTPIWNLPHGVTKIVSNVNATHAILTDSSLWAWGNSPQSEAGTGANLDRNRTSALLGPYPANWSWDYSTPLIVTSPTQIISTRHDFVNIYGAMPYTYWMFDEAANGQIYFNGRNKGTIANNGEINPDTAVGSQGSYYDNSWNKLTPVPVDLFSLRSIISIPAPPCAVNGAYPGCNGYTPPPVLPPTINAGTDKAITVFTANLVATSTPASGRKVAAFIWSQIAGPNYATFSTLNDSITTVSGLAYGTYTFRITAIDNLNSQAYDDINVVVSAGIGGYNGGIQVGLGEYVCHFIAADGTLTAIGNRGFTGVGGFGSGAGSVGVPEPVIVTPSNLKFKYVAGHFHGAAAVDVNGRVWTMGGTEGGESGMGNIDYYATPQKILVDSLGNTFDSVAVTVAIEQSNGDNLDQNGYLAVKSTGTLWIWGTVGAMLGNGTDNPSQKILRPLRINMPGGRLIKQMIGGNYCIALCTDETVWTWGNVYKADLGYDPVGLEYTTPHQILSNVAQIAGGQGFNYAVKTNGDLYGWGLKGFCMNSFNAFGGAEILTPTLLTNVQAYLPMPITKIVTNLATTTALLSDGSLYSWGDNTQGSVGNGETYFGNFFGDDNVGYGYDYIAHLIQKVPINIAPTRTFKNIFAGNLLTYYTYALGTDDQLYAWGTNRGSVIANRVEQPVNGLLNGLDNSWNVPYPTPVNPWTIPQGTRITSTCPACLLTPNVNPCNYYPIPANTKPTAATSGNQSIVGTTSAFSGNFPAGALTTLDGTSSFDSVYITYYRWSQVSGPNNAVIDLPASPTPIVSGMIAGVYTFKLKVTDNGWLSDSTTMTVTVNSGTNIPPVASAGTSYSITLPQYTSYLYGSGTDIDGTIASYAWSQVSGTAATIVSPSSATTNIGGLTSVGVRVFRLTVTDSGGLTATSDITITVKADCN